MNNDNNTKTILVYFHLFRYLNYLDKECPVASKHIYYFNTPDVNI